MKKTVLLLISALTFLMGSCSSLPLPGSYDESLLVIPIKIDKNLGSHQGKRRILTMAYLEIRNIETGKKKKLTLIPGKDDFFSAVVSPGRYRIEEELVIAVSQTPGSDSWLNREKLSASPMLIEERIVYLSPMVLKVEGDGKGDYNYSFYSTTSLDDPVKEAGYEALISERRFRAWELYQLAGWEKTE